ncbi:polyprotein [Phytophthora megakarya]|uniref:Polyprotein n=1 Tax=Phytophthora megakarya TaxID=4795 RepID=A0A225VDH4_9STRA|nr:polyprotein [Phytophthora megakarya]
MHATNMTNLLWGEAVLHTVDKLNLLPNAPLRGKSPHKLIFGSTPVLRHLRTWGLLAHAYVPPETRSTRAKLDTRSTFSLFLGYSMKTTGYKLMDLRTGAVAMRRSGNVHFHEKFTVAQDYMRRLLWNTYQHGAHDLPAEIPVVPITSGLEDRFFPEAGIAPNIPRVQTATNLPAEMELAISPELGGISQPFPASATTSQPAARERAQKQKKRRSTPRLGDSSSDEDRPPSRAVPPAEVRSRSTRRTRNLPEHLRDYVVGSVLNTVADIPIPNTYKQAKASKYWPEWKATMEDGLAPLRDHGT